MAKRKADKTESLPVMLAECIPRAIGNRPHEALSKIDRLYFCRSSLRAAGAWYWFRAEGQDENMVRALNCMRYRSMIQRFESLGIPCPTPDEIFAYAAEKWPAHKLHAAPKAAV